MLKLPRKMLETQAEVPDYDEAAVKKLNTDAEALVPDDALKWAVAGQVSTAVEQNQNLKVLQTAVNATVAEIPNRIEKKADKSYVDSLATATAPYRNWTLTAQQLTASGLKTTSKDIVGSINEVSAKANNNTNLIITNTNDITDLTAEVAKKANQTDLTTLSNRVDLKAEQSSLDAMFKWSAGSNPYLNYQGKSFLTMRGKQIAILADGTSSTDAINLGQLNAMFKWNETDNTTLDFQGTILSMNNKNLSGLADATLDQQAVNKRQLDLKQDKIEGVTFGSGEIFGLETDKITIFSNATNKEYVDKSLATKVNQTDLDKMWKFDNNKPPYLDYQGETDLYMNSKKIFGLADGEGGTDAINKSQLDAAIQNVTGSWVTPAELEKMWKKDSDDYVTFGSSHFLHMNDQQIYHVADPTSDSDATTKKYVDGKISYALSKLRSVVENLLPEKHDVVVSLFNELERDWKAETFSLPEASKLAKTQKKTEVKPSKLSKWFKPKK